MIASADEIRGICHELLNRLLDVNVAFRADCVKLGKYDHDSQNLRLVLEIDAAFDAAKGAYVAAVSSGDVRKTLEGHHDMYRPGTGTRGIPGAMREINALITRICGRDADSLAFRQELAKKDGAHVWLTAEEQSLSTPHPSPPRYLRARCLVRYWEDARVDGVKDMDGSRIPCREGTPTDNTPLGGGIWGPTIELETGRIEGWPAGTKAEILYKVCERGKYEWLDANRNVVRVIEGNVPAIMSPADEPDGDYVSMVVGPDGLIEDWRNIPPPSLLG